MSTAGSADRELMTRALGLAARGLYTTTPNPRVGCVIARGADVLGEGWHERAGGPHAEVAALEDARANGRDVRVVTCDLSFAAAAYAAKSLAGLDGASVVQADVLALPFRDRSFDVVMCSLFAHHFPTPVVARFLVAMHGISRRGVIVNDLHRHPLAYAGIWTLTRVFPAGPIVRNDGPLSVRRAFVRDDFDELERLTRLRFTVRWRWAFRWQVLIPRDAEAESVDA